MIRGQNQRVAEASLMSSEPPNLSAVVRDISTRGHIRARHHFVIRVTQLLHMRETSVSSRVRTKLSRDARGSHSVLHNMCQSIGRKTPKLHFISIRKTFRDIGEKKSVVMTRQSVSCDIVFMQQRRQTD